MLLSVVISLILQTSSAEPAASATVQSTCCSQVFLSSDQQFAVTNQESLGIYTISQQRIANNQHPVYIKNTDHGDHYLYFREKGGVKVNVENLFRFYLQMMNFPKDGL